MIIKENINNLTLTIIYKTDINKPKTFKYYEKNQYIIEYNNDFGESRYFNTSQDNYEKALNNKESLLYALIEKEDSENSLFIELDLEFFDLLDIKVDK